MKSQKVKFKNTHKRICPYSPRYKTQSCRETEHTGLYPHVASADGRAATLQAILGRLVKLLDKHWRSLPVPTDRLSLRKYPEECFMRNLGFRSLRREDTQAEAPTGCAVESRESTPPPEIRQTGVRVTVTREPSL